MRQNQADKMTIYHSIKIDRIFLSIEWDRSFIRSLNHELVQVGVDGDQKRSPLSTTAPKMKSGNYLNLQLRSRPQLLLTIIEGVDFEEAKEHMYTAFPHLNIYTRWMKTKNLLTGDILRWERVANIGDYDDGGGFHQNRPQMLLKTINGHIINRADGSLLYSDKDLAIAADLMQIGFCSWQPEKRKQVIAPISCASPILGQELRDWHKLNKSRRGLV